MKYRGTLMERKKKQPTAEDGSGVRRRPAEYGELEGGDVSVRDDVMRTDADKTPTPPSSKSTKVIDSLPGKAGYTPPRLKKRGMRMTAREAAAILGKRA